MRQTSTFLSLLIGLAAVATSGCRSGGVGDPCIPEDEYRRNFGGYAETEVNVESKSFQCETRVCLVANFRGRVSCPYGNEAGGQCFIPGTDNAQENLIQAPVPAQLQDRRPDDAVYCSCRCAGSGADEATLCECPSGFECRKLIDNFGLGDEQLAGSYCVRDGTYIQDPRTELQGKAKCEGTPAPGDEGAVCGEPHPFGVGTLRGN